MIEVVRKDIISTFDECISNFGKKDIDINEFANLSNHTIHNASVFQDSGSISAALIVYSIYKILERAGADEIHLIVDKMVPLMKKGILSLQKADLDEYKNDTKEMFNAIATLDKRFKVFIEDVMWKARIKKGGKLYEHGVSIARAAEVLGITQWELMSYVGKTEITDYDTTKEDVKERIRFTKSIFNI